MQTINPEDTSVLVAMMAAMQEDDPWSVPFEPARAREAVEELLQNPMYGRAWFVEEDGRRIGYIVMSFDYSLEFGGRNAWVDEFFIEKESRGRGIGAQVLNLFEQVVREAGAMAIHLGVSRGNRAIDLYRRQGFREHQGRFLTKFLW